MNKPLAWGGAAAADGPTACCAPAAHLSSRLATDGCTATTPGTGQLAPRAWPSCRASRRRYGGPPLLGLQRRSTATAARYGQEMAKHLGPQQRARDGQQCICPWPRTATLELRASRAWVRRVRPLGWAHCLECAHRRWRGSRPGPSPELHWQLQRGRRGDDLARYSDFAWRVRSACAAGRTLRCRAWCAPAPATASGCWRLASLRRHSSSCACRRPCGWVHRLGPPHCSVSGARRPRRAAALLTPAYESKRASAARGAGDGGLRSRGQRGVRLVRQLRPRCTWRQCERLIVHDSPAPLPCLALQFSL